MRTILIAFLVLIGATAAADVSEPLYNRVVVMLSAYESQPLAAEWRKLGPASVSVLGAIANDANQPTFRRARALIALGHFESESAAAILRELADCEGCNESLRRHALLGLSASRPDEAVPIAALALVSTDPATRLVAKSVLQRSDQSGVARVLGENPADEDIDSLAARVRAALSGAR